MSPEVDAGAARVRQAATHAARVWSRIAVVFMTLALIANAASMVSSCAGSQRREVIAAELVALNAARDGFVEMDKKFQLAIVDKATTREQAEEELKLYRAWRGNVTAAFSYCYELLAHASVKDDDASLATARDKTKVLIGILSEIQPGKPLPVGAPSGDAP